MSEAKKNSILVNGEEVSNALVEQELQMLRERYSAEMSYEEMVEQQDKIESDARENAVERVLLMQKAREEIVDLRPEEVEARFAALKDQHGGEEEFAKRFELEGGDEAKIKADIADGVRLEKYFEELCKDAVRPSEICCRSYYDFHPEEFETPETVHAAHIVQHPSADIPVEKVYAELLNVRERLKAGEDFIALAREYSHCEDDGYDLGYFTRGQMVSAFEEVAFSTVAGEYSDVFQSEFGYHVLKVFDRKPSVLRAFKEVRYEIESMLYDERKNEVIGIKADKLRAMAKIENLEVVET